MDREMYMNCALVNINNPNKSLTTFNAPEIFKANIGPFGMYGTIEGADVQFPDPGISIDQSLGDRRLNQPFVLNERPVILPDAALEVGTEQQSGTTTALPSIAITQSGANRKAYQLGYIFLLAVSTSVLYMLF